MLAPGKQHTSFTSICAARGSVPSKIIGRARRREITTRLAEVETSAACFGLGGPPNLVRPSRSADGSGNRMPPGGVNARGTRGDLPGAKIVRHFVAIERGIDRYRLHYGLHQAGELQPDARNRLAHSKGRRVSHEVH